MTLEPEDKVYRELAEKGHPAGNILQEEAQRNAGELPQVEGRVPVGRWDHELIAQLVTPGASVLDLGCGDGTLLAGLIKRGERRCQGVERDPEMVARCVAAGVPIIQADLDEGLLAFFPDGGFDFVILEKTLQVITRPAQVLQEVLRIGRACVVSFPNFGHWKIRSGLVHEGRMPNTRTLPHEWYDTPNIRMLTIRDFEAFCEEQRIQVLDRFVFAEGRYRRMEGRDNLLAEEALYLLRRE